MFDGFLLLGFPRIHHVGFGGNGRSGEAHFLGALLNPLDESFGVRLREDGVGHNGGAVGGEADGGGPDAVHAVQHAFQTRGAGGAVHAAHSEKKFFRLFHVPLLRLPISDKLL